MTLFESILQSAAIEIYLCVLFVKTFGYLCSAVSESFLCLSLSPLHVNYERQWLSPLRFHGKGDSSEAPSARNGPVRYSPWKRNRTLTFAMSLDQSFEQCVFTFEWESLHLRSSPYMLIDLLASLVLHYLIPFLDLNVPSVYKMPTRNYYLASWALNDTKMIHAVALSHSKSIRMSVRAE